METSYSIPNSCINLNSNKSTVSLWLIHLSIQNVSVYFISGFVIHDAFTCKKHIIVAKGSSTFPLLLVISYRTVVKVSCFKKYIYNLNGYQIHVEW